MLTMMVYVSAWLNFVLRGIFAQLVNPLLGQNIVCPIMLRIKSSDIIVPQGYVHLHVVQWVSNFIQTANLGQIFVHLPQIAYVLAYFNLAHANEVRKILLVVHQELQLLHAILDNYASL